MNALLESLLVPEGSNWTYFYRRLDEFIPFNWHYHLEFELTLTVNSRGQRYVGEVPKSFRCRTRARAKPSRADDLLAHSPKARGQPWRAFRLARQTGADQVWRAKAIPVHVGQGARPGHRLVVAENAATGEVKYFVTSAPASVGLGVLLRVAFTRWNVEHVLRVAKSEIGMTHYEGRNYVGLARHLILCAVALGFVVGAAIAGQTFYLFTVENLKQFGALKAMGVNNWRIVGMSLLQALVVGSIGYGLGVGGAALFGVVMTKAARSVPPAFFMTWQILVGTGLAVLLIVLLSSLVSIRRVLFLEPAIVFKT